MKSKDLFRSYKIIECSYYQYSDERTEYTEVTVRETRIDWNSG